MRCEYCGAEHDGKFGSGRFCSRSCANRFSNKFVSPEGRERQIKALNDPDNRQKSKDNHYRNEIPYQRPSYNKTTMKEGSKILTSKRLGIVGEIATIKKFIERGIPVYLPYGDTETADIAAEFGGKIQKIQVKSTSSIPSDGSHVSFYIKAGKYNIKNGHVITSNDPYTKDDVDYFSLYDYNQDRLFLLENDGKRKGIHLRYDKPKSNQSININMADDYDFDTVMDHIENKPIEVMEFFIKDIL